MSKLVARTKEALIKCIAEDTILQSAKANGYYHGTDRAEHFYAGYVAAAMGLASAIGVKHEDIVDIVNRQG